MRHSTLFLIGWSMLTYSVYDASGVASALGFFGMGLALLAIGRAIRDAEYR
jgi:hypothetical protein